MSGPPFLLRLEGLVVLALSLLFYGIEGGSWQHEAPYALLLFVPDLSMLGYLGERVSESARRHPGTRVVSYKETIFTAEQER